MIGRAEIEAALVAHGAVAAVVVTTTKGSSPRDAGAMMLVFEGGILGTIGGGTVEHRCIAEAERMLQNRDNPETFVFPLGPDLDQCCGGQMQVQIGLVQPIGARLWPDGPAMPPDPSRRQVIIYGSGHVGQALVRALAPLPFRITLVDSRPDAPSAHGAEVHATPLPEAVAEEAGEECFHIVLTHSHATDLEIVSAILAKASGFCGLIGSDTKRALFERRLRERGFTDDAISNLTCPIGLPMLKDKRPEVIAASVAVQLLLRDSVLREQAR